MTVSSDDPETGAKGRPKGGRMVSAATMLALMRDEIARAWRYDRVLCVALGRIDAMDRPRDGTVRLEAHEIEESVARRIAGDVRLPDSLAMFGSGEIAVLLPETGVRNARIAMERVCETVAATRFEVRGIGFGATVSIGVAGLTHRIRTIEQLLGAARHEWRRAVAAGGNCVHSTEVAPATLLNRRSAELH